MNRRAQCSQTPPNPSATMVRVAQGDHTGGQVLVMRQRVTWGLGEPKRLNHFGGRLWVWAARSSVGAGSCRGG